MTGSLAASNGYLYYGVTDGEDGAVYEMQPYGENRFLYNYDEESEGGGSPVCGYHDRPRHGGPQNQFTTNHATVAVAGDFGALFKVISKVPAPGLGTAALTMTLELAARAGVRRRAHHPLTTGPMFASMSIDWTVWRRRPNGNRRYRQQDWIHGRAPRLVKGPPGEDRCPTLRSGSRSGQSLR
jgi:hypothetical protein